MHVLTCDVAERVDYFTTMQRRAHTDPITRILLLSLSALTAGGSSHLKSELIPILPHPPEIPVERSSVLPHLLEGTEPSEAEASLMGPGPWTISPTVQLPDMCSIIHPSNRNVSSPVRVTHTLKIVMRVECPDLEDTQQSARKKKQLYDLIVRIPVHILSVSSVSLCWPE